ncbi:MAG: hypothetical protein ABFD83_09200 [Armatimonadota bacterium]
MKASFVFMAALVLLTSTSAIAETYADDTFVPTNWSNYTISSYSSNSMSYGYVQMDASFSGQGHFNGYMNVDNVWVYDPGTGMYRYDPGVVQLLVGFLQHDAVYTPSNQGAIVSMSWTYDAEGSVSGTGGGFFDWRPVVRQNGSFFEYNGEHLYSNDGSLHAISLDGLSAKDFGWGSHPDFSKNGSQIEMGGIISGGCGPVSSCSSVSLSLDVDNWQVNIYDVPEPSTTGFLISSLIMLGLLRRSRP